MFNSNDIWSCNKKFKVATGLDLNEAELLLEDFITMLYEKRHPKSKAGRPPKLESKDIFLMLLVFVRQVTSQ